MMKFVLFCPEQMGGLSTPRPASNIIGGDGLDVIMGRARVISIKGQDVTESFLRGAYMALDLAKSFNASSAIMKNKSPSCGLQTPYCQSPSGCGIGVTAALFRLYGIEMIELSQDQDLSIKELLSKPL